MNKSQAQEYAVELLESAADGEWGSLLQIGLGADLLEHLRQLQQINTEITKLESREKQMNDAFVGRLQLLDFDDDPTTDGGDSAPGASVSDDRGSGQPTPQKAPGFDLSDLGMPQRRNVA